MGSRKPTVVYWNGTPSPYIEGRFEAVVRRGNLDFQAWFNQRREPDRSWEVREQTWTFPARYVPLRPAFGWRLRLPIPELADVRPDLLVSLYATPSFAAGAVAARGRGIRVAFRVLPTFETWVRRSVWKEALKHALFRMVDGVKVPGPDGAAVARRYGVPADRIHPVTQSVDVAHYARARELDPETRRLRRLEMGLRGCVFLYVGRVWSGKGLDYLFQAYRQVVAEYPEVSLLVVGDGVDEARYRALTANWAGVTFTGFIQARDLPEYYGLADVLVFPTLGDPHGLVVEEGMAAGLPVICTEAAGDIRRRLPDGEAGFVVPPAAAEPLARRMLQLARDQKLRARLGNAASRLVQSRTHEQWAADFETFVDRMLSMPSRQSTAAAVARVVGTLLQRAAGRQCCPAPLLNPSRGEL